MRSPQKILLGLLVLVSGVYARTAIGQETLPQLVDIGASAGFNLVGHGRGTAWADLDGDGLEDFGVGLMADGLLHAGGFWYYRNLGNYKFEERREQAGLVVEETVYGVTLPDVDNDGDSDVFVNCGGYQVTAPFPEKNRLFLNDGHGVFTEVPDAGGLGLLGFNFTSAWDDINGDGLLDVFICRLDPDGSTPDRRLFLNRGNATFEDITGPVGLLSTTVDSHQAVFVDYDGDGDPDLALANRDGRPSLEEPPRPPNQLYRNDGNLVFVDVSQPAGISNGFGGFVADISDFDRDGDLDIFMGAYNNLIMGTFVPGAHDDLYRNDGSGHFAEISVQAGVANVGGSMGARFWDMDNDGWPDLYVSKVGQSRIALRRTSCITTWGTVRSKKSARRSDLSTALPDTDLPRATSTMMAIWISFFLRGAWFTPPRLDRSSTRTWGRPLPRCPSVRKENSGTRTPWEHAYFYRWATCTRSAKLPRGRDTPRWLRRRRGSEWAMRPRSTRSP